MMQMEHRMIYHKKFDDYKLIALPFKVSDYEMEDFARKTST